MLLSAAARNMSSDDEDGSDDDSVLRAFLNNFGGNIADLDDPLHEEVAEVEAAEDGAADYAPSPKRQRGRPKGKSASEWGIVVHHALSKPAAKLLWTLLKKFDHFARAARPFSSPPQRVLLVGVWVWTMGH